MTLYSVQSELIYVFSDLTANKIKGVTVHVYICFNPLVFKNNSTNDYIHVGRSRLFIMIPAPTTFQILAPAPTTFQILAPAPAKICPAPQPCC